MSRTSILFTGPDRIRQCAFSPYPRSASLFAFADASYIHIGASHHSQRLH
jgi:hypothetical protein